MKDDMQASSGFNYYQNANAEAEAIKAGFLVRQYEYSVILDDLLRNGQSGSVQHYLLLGRRGSGKSTLLRRIQIEIDTTTELNETYIAVNLAEEQANIYRFYDLLEEITRELEFQQVAINWPDDSDIDLYSRGLLDAIHGGLSKSGKRLVLLLDNIDRIFESLGEEVALLREYLQNHTDIKVIGGSTRMTEHFWSYNNPFYDFFRVLQLKPLDSDEMKKLLFHWSDQMNIPKLREFIETQPGKLETVRTLTDGLPRTLQFFVNILLTHDQATGYDYLRLIMDKVTPLYQERLNHLPPSQRKIVLQLAFCWDSVGAKELAAATRMDNKVVSAQLGQLIEKGVAEKIPTCTKNYLYRLSERFFNLWLIFTQGSPREKRRARYLSIFLENFYNSEEFRKMVTDHYWKVKQENISPNKAVLLTKALAQSRYINSFWRDILIDETIKLPGFDMALKRELPEKIRDILDVIFDGPRANIKKASEMIHAVEQRDGVKEFLFGLLNKRTGDLEAAERYFLASVENGYEIAAAYLAELYDEGGDTNKAELYFIMAYNSEIVDADYNLAFFYYKENIHKRDALSIVEKAMERGDAGIDIKILSILLKVWNGVFGNLKEQVCDLIADESVNIEPLFGSLLAHYQVSLVKDLLESDPQLMDKGRPIYYVAQTLLPNANINLLKIPPEFGEMVNRLCDEVYTVRNYFYGDPPSKS